ncbi:MAG TPA: flagellar hook-associated protein FlgK [Burkholderiaceae bacterium]|nr:flagellar hook-associated protein FlgK [Burkholderiaceae bacterium]
MSIGIKAMFANYAALQTTGHNIANAHVEGYSRQTVELETARGQFTGAGFFGKGVDVATVTRAHDAFLTREAAVARSQAEADRTRLEHLARLETVFPPGEPGLGHAAGQLLNALVDVASNPQDASARQVVLAQAQDLALRFATAGQQLDALQNGVTQDLKHAVAGVNEIAARIAQANDQIAASFGAGQPANDLLDLRDRLVSQLSAQVQVTTIPAQDGTLGVFIAGGQRLVLGADAAQLALVPDPFDASRQRIAIVDAGVQRPLDAALLGAGAIGGALRFQDEDLAAARDALGRLATALGTRINEQQSLGLNLLAPPGAGEPLFALGAPRALAASTNARDVNGNFVGSVAMSVVDASALQASEYELGADPVNAGRYLLTRRSDGLVRSIASGDTVDGLAITVTAAAATDRFLLQPFARSAIDMRRALDDPRGIAAASPLEATRNVANTGTATVGGLRIVDASVDPNQTASIAFTSAAGDYAWELRDRTTSALLSSGTGTWQAGQPIVLNGFALQLAGVPANGDAFSVARTAYPGTSNGNALALLALRDEAFVGGDTVTDAYAGLMAGIGVDVQGARSAADISAAVARQADAQKASQAGVNLDEEAARLLQFQQSYQAAAKVLQVAQSVFDTLLQTAGR